MRARGPRLIIRSCLVALCIVACMLVPTVALAAPPAQTITPTLHIAKG